MQKKTTGERAGIDEAWIIAYGELLESVLTRTSSPLSQADEQNQIRNYYTDDWTDSGVSSIYVDATQQPLSPT